MRSEKLYYRQAKQRATEREVEQNILNGGLALIIGFCLGYALPIGGEILIAQLAGHSSADPRHAIFPIIFLMIVGVWVHLCSKGKVHVASWCFQISFTSYLYYTGQGESQSHSVLSIVQPIIVSMLALRFIFAKIAK